MQFFECNQYPGQPRTWFTCTRADVRLADRGAGEAADDGLGSTEDPGEGLATETALPW